MAEARPLDVRVQHGARDGTTVVQAAGELDFTSINRLRAVLLPLVARGTVVLEATEVTFCDSAGLLAILQANRDARAKPSRFIPRHCRQYTSIQGAGKQKSCK